MADSLIFGRGLWRGLVAAGAVGLHHPISRHPPAAMLRHLRME